MDIDLKMVVGGRGSGRGRGCLIVEYSKTGVGYIGWYVMSEYLSCCVSSDIYRKGVALQCVSNKVNN